jgi:hypothetical protein
MRDQSDQGVVHEAFCAELAGIAGFCPAQSSMPRHERGTDGSVILLCILSSFFSYAF